MKNTILIVAILFSTTAFAKPVNTDEQFCREISGLAKTTMSLRQEGVSVVRQMEILEETGANEVLGRMMEVVIEDAYKQPAFSTSEYKLRTATEFSNKWYIGCKQILRSK
jgi:ABC-type Na+ efflux pump permease subunit